LKYSLGSTRRRSNSKGLATETQSNSKDRVFKSCRQIYENLLSFVYTGEVLSAENAGDGERSNTCHDSLSGVENAPTRNPICCCATQGVSGLVKLLSLTFWTAMLQATPMSMHLLEIAVSRLGGIHTIFLQIVCGYS
jgi:hypothetical protein